MIEMKIVRIESAYLSEPLGFPNNELCLAAILRRRVDLEEPGSHARSKAPSCQPTQSG